MPAVKRAFSLTEAEVAQPTKIVKVAQRIPKPQKTGDVLVDDSSTIQHEHLQKIVSKLWRHPDVIVACSSWVDKRVDMVAEAQTRGLLASVSILKALDEEFACSWIARQSPNLNMGAMEKLLVKDPDTWRHLMIYALVASPFLKLPIETKDRGVMKNALDKRASTCGDRLAAVKADANGDKLSIDWLKFGVYSLEFNSDGVLVKITHTTTKEHTVIDPSIILVSKKWKLEQNWSDYSAELTLKPHKHTCCDFFADGVGPKKIALINGKSKIFNDIVTQAVQDVKTVRQKKAEDDASQAAVQPNFREATKLQGRKAAMERAREALLKKKADLASSRVIALEDSPTVVQG